MAATPAPEEPRLDLWGFPVPQYDPPAVEPELGWTTDEDGGWGTNLGPGPTISEFAWPIIITAVNLLKFAVYVSGILTRGQRR